ncbi:MAG TPA: GTPase HflX [Clostridia bacterium]|nr:GTPase HflX [Clostridia bacterium]HPQ47461.1 GTPase HflX [Clostridia bacterium]
MAKEITGNTNGLKRSILERLEKLYDIKSDPSFLCDQQIIDEICEITGHVNREISVFVSPRGKTEEISIGDFKTVTMRRVDIDRQTRCIHTHPGPDSTLSAIDLDTLKNTDMAVMAAVGTYEGRPNGISCAYVDIEGEPVISGPYVNVMETDDLILEMLKYGSNKEIEKDREREIVIAAGVSRPGQSALLDELAELIDSAGGICVHKEEQQRESFDPASYMGRGKIQELNHICRQYDADTIVFDDSLTPAQIRNIEQMLNVKVLDRSSLILDIFAQRAHSKEGKLQVELAQLSYMLPRLTGRGAQLSRLGGGIGTRGPGESKLETDRRHILRKINILKRELRDTDARREILTNNRRKQNMFTIALAGYTNAGKSTLINKMTDSSVFAEDMLFATLDPSARRFELPSGEAVILMDTVGFVSKLPHELVEAFKSTLDVVAQADLILHVMDGSSPRMDAEKDIVDEILGELGAGGIPVIEVVNKIDLAGGLYTNSGNSDRRFYISALTGEGIPELVKRMEIAAEGSRRIAEVNIGYDQGRLISYIHENTEVLEKEYLEDSIRFKLRLTAGSLDKINAGSVQ